MSQTITADIEFIAVSRALLQLALIGGGTFIAMLLVVILFQILGADQ